MTARELEIMLSEKAGLDIRVVFTDNTHSLLTFNEKSPAIYTLRIHWMFREADPETVRALALYLAGIKPAANKRQLDYFIALNSHLIRSQPLKGRIILRPKGTFYDLQEIFDKLNEEYFEEAISADITWGNNQKQRSGQRTIRLGSYFERPGRPLIRLHPALDHNQVPRCVVERVVFHEMLHQVFGLSPGRLHPKEFSKAEQRYRHNRKAINWEKKNIDWLLGRRQFAFHLPRE